MTTAYAYELSSGELPEPLRGAFGDAENGDVAYVALEGHRVAIVPEQVATAGEGALRALEDAEDLALMREARKSGPSIPWEQAETELDELNKQGR